MIMHSSGPWGTSGEIWRFQEPEVNVKSKQIWLPDKPIDASNQQFRLVCKPVETDQRNTVASRMYYMLHYR